VGHWDAEWIGLATLGLAAIAMIAGSLLFPDRENPAVEEA
jgi:hypothetical protein